MTRQQSITLSQVRFKVSEARRRALSKMELAVSATNEADFDRYMFESAKAAKDVETWSIVLRSLEQ